MHEYYIYLKKDGEIVKQQQVTCESQKLAMIEKWEKLYGKKFSELTIEEEPRIKKKKPSKAKAGVKYGNIYATGRKSNKGFNRSWNGYKD